jgi:hypothetical protein
MRARLQTVLWLKLRPRGEVHKVVGFLVVALFTGLGLGLFAGHQARTGERRLAPSPRSSGIQAQTGTVVCISGMSRDDPHYAYGISPSSRWRRHVLPADFRERPWIPFAWWFICGLCSAP